MVAESDSSTLIAAAEKHLLREELDDALRLAKEALNSRGLTEAEALRVSILAQRGLADKKNRKPDEADRIAEDSLARFCKEGDKRGQALMLLTLAAMNSHGRGAKRCRQAKEWGQDAVELLRELQEKRFEALAWLELSTVAAKQEERDELLKTTGSAMALFAELQDRRGLGICQQKIGTAHQMKGDYKAAFEKANKALSLFREIGEQSLEGNTLCLMSKWYLKVEKPEEALPLAEEALKLAQAPDAIVSEAPALMAVLNAHQCFGQAEDARQVAQQAVDRHMSSGNQVGQLVALECLIGVLFGQQSHAEALDAADQALDLSRALHDELAEMRMLLNTYDIYYAKDDLQSAMDSANGALAVAKDLGDATWESRIQAKIAHTHFCQHSTDEVIKLSGTVKDLGVRSEDRQVEGIGIMMKHGVHAVQGELEEALSTGMEAQEIFAEVGDKMRESLTWYSISEVHGVSNKLDAALFAQEQSLNLWKQMDNRPGIVKALFGLAELHLMLRSHSEPEKIVLQLGRYTHIRTKDEILRQILFARVCLRTRENKGKENQRLGGEMLDKALRAANKALKMLEELEGKPLYRGKAMLCRSEVLAASGIYEQALAVAEEARRSFASCKDELGDQAREKGEAGEALVLALVASVHFEKGELREASRCADDAVRLAANCQDWKAEHRCLEVLEQVEEAMQSVQSQMQGYQGALPTEEQLADMAAPSLPAAVAVTVKKGVDVELANRKLVAMMTEMFSTDDEIHLDTDVLETGLDSLSSLDLVGQLSKEFKGVHLSPTLLFDFPCIREIGQHIHEASLED